MFDRVVDMSLNNVKIKNKNKGGKRFFFVKWLSHQTSWSLISCREHFQSLSLLQTLNTAWAEFSPSQNFDSGFYGWSFSVVITTVT